MHLSERVIKRSQSDCMPVAKTNVAGFGLPMAIFIITVMAFVAVAINNISEDGAKMTSVNALSMRAFYAAESGANIALNRMFTPGGGGNLCTSSPIVNGLNFSQAGLSQCAVTVACSIINPSGPNIQYQLTSTGTCGSGADQATRIVRVVAE